MPARAMTYKVLNTFIDDLFAFTIKMPTLHRLATFRDDVIFFVYLYQSYAYKVDTTRVNEFGQGGEEEVVVEDKEKEKENDKDKEGKVDMGEGVKATGSQKEKAGAKKRR